jgi:hypothetical protein
MKQIFLDSLSKTGNDLDIFISRFMDIKSNIGNGVGAGKLFERLFVDFVNKKMEGLYSVHLNLSNSLFIWDILVSDKEIESKKEEITSIVRSGVSVESRLINLLGENWIGVSLKTYKEDACQITTDYSYRTFLEEKVSESFADGSTLNEFFELLNKHDNNRYVILALNTYDRFSAHNSIIEKLKNSLLKTKDKSKTLYLIKNLESKEVENDYTFRLLSFDKKFDRIVYKKNKKLSQYDLSINGVNYFKVLYGKNQANPFQRGIWTHNKNSIEYFTLVKSGKYKTDTDYFNDKILSTINS